MSDPSQSRSPFRRRALVLAAAALALGVGGFLAVYPQPPLPAASLPPEAAPAPADLTLLVAGDTGGDYRIPSLREGQLAVARGMVEEDLAHPADALLLLGDNFYPDGLERERMVAQIRRNLVWPYCRFVSLDGPRSAEVAPACTLPERLRRPIPIHAILGNHDLDSAESPGLQANEVARFVANWNLTEEPAVEWRPAPGVSVVLVASETLDAAGAERVREVIARSAGPWRIVAAHRPIAPVSQGRDPQLSRLLRRAVAEAGVPVQLFLSGHEHSLHLIEGEAPLAALHVVIGSSARPKPVERRYRGERFARARTGFGVLDLRRAEGRLVVTLFETPRYPTVFWRPPHVAARVAVGLDGGLAWLGIAPDRDGGPPS